nr:DUF4214 domain-containing protein [Lachnospiraceae bacterium]
DEDGLKYWTKQIEDEGKTVADLIRGVIGSAEFEAKKLSDGDYVDTLYKVCCNRASDAEGKKYWTDKLGAGTDRDAVLESFLNSQEYADVCANSNVNSGTSTPSKTPSRATLSFVERLYKKCLGRSSESDGKDYWAGNITSKKVSGSAVARGFFFSAEYTAKNRTNEEFVTDLYASIFGREADSEGYQYWLNKLKNGTSREEVFNGFANSKEWDGMCNKYGITK